MSHLTDGEIHVCLDGALDLLSDRRAAEVREHLAQCGDCRSRLEEERRIRARASEILGTATVGSAEVDAPSFEKIRQRAGTRSAGDPGQIPAGPQGRATRSDRSRESWYRGLAWAATIVLSLGIGWYAGSGVRETEVRARPTLTRPPGPDGGASVSPPPSAPVVAETAPAREPSGQNAASTGGEPGRRTAVRSADGAASVEGAASVQGSLAVPGLPVMSVAWSDDGGGQAVTVVQRLPSGDPLTLRYTDRSTASMELSDRSPLSPGAPDRAAEPEAEADDELAPGPAAAERVEGAESSEARDEPVTGPLRVTRRHGSWFLEARSPLEPDSVRALLDRLPPIP